MNGDGICECGYSVGLQMTACPGTLDLEIANDIHVLMQDVDAILCDLVEDQAHVFREAKIPGFYFRTMFAELWVCG